MSAHQTRRLVHDAMVKTARQEAREASGRRESLPGDYQAPTEAQRRLAVARRVLEDRRMLRELGLLGDL